MASSGTFIAVIVVAVLAIIFLPKIMQTVKAGGGFNLGNLFGATGAGGTGGGTQTSVSKQSSNSNGTSKSYTRTVCNNGNCDIDVSGNGCACANGVCEGNCSDMEQIDLDNFDPLEWVEQHT